MPKNFLDNLESKMGIFKRLKLKIKDEEVKKNIDRIWIRWSRVLFDKERRAEEGQRRNDVLVMSSHIGGDSFIFSPSYTNTPSVASLKFSPSPLNCSTPAEDRIIENISIPVYTKINPNERCGFYKYCKKQSGKFVCMMENCRVSDSKRKSGVTLESLRGHARKDHSIEVNIKQRRGETSQPIICEYCSKTFIRKQTLKSHIAKLHRDNSSSVTVTVPTTPANVTVGATPVTVTVPTTPVTVTGPATYLFPGQDLPQSHLQLTDWEKTIQNCLTPDEIYRVRNILDEDLF